MHLLLVTQNIDSFITLLHVSQPLIEAPTYVWFLGVFLRCEMIILRSRLEARMSSSSHLLNLNHTLEQCVVVRNIPSNLS